MKKAFIQLTPIKSISFSYNTLAEKVAILKEEADIDYVPTVEELAEVTDLQTVRNEYIAAVARLEQIESFSGTITLTIVGNAIKDIARILRLLLKLSRRQYNGDQVLSSIKQELM